MKKTISIYTTIEDFRGASKESLGVNIQAHAIERNTDNLHPFPRLALGVTLDRNAIRSFAYAPGNLEHSDRIGHDNVAQVAKKIVDQLFKPFFDGVERLKLSEVVVVGVESFSLSARDALIPYLIE